MILNKYLTKHVVVIIQIIVIIGTFIFIPLISTNDSYIFLLKDEKLNRILFIGNSITKNPPYPSINWYGNWGMSASEESNDYVHLLLQKLGNPEYEILNVANWERNFSFPLIHSKMIPSIIIIRLGENVPNIDTYEDMNNFHNHLTNLINFYNTNNGKVYVTSLVGGCWDSWKKDEVLSNLGYHFIQLTLNSDDFNNTDSHPNNNGMIKISNQIFSIIK